MMFVLKLPILYLIGVVWWAVRATPDPYEPAALVAAEPDPEDPIAPACPWRDPRRSQTVVRGRRRAASVRRA